MIVKAKKSLGQHWLKNDQIIQEIITAAALTPPELVLEVGPGQGVLTTALLEVGAKVIAIEKDDALINLLRDRLAAPLAAGALQLIHHDVLKFDPIIINQPYKVVANLPYYLTGQFLKQFLTTPHQPSLMVLMLQKEVAERIVAAHKKESILSISVKAYGTPRYRRTVARGHFQPVPKVDSAILTIENISKNFFTKNNLSEAHFFSVLKKGFAGKRKKLKNNLPLSGPALAKFGERRAEDLQLNDWLEICAMN